MKINVVAAIVLVAFFGIRAVIAADGTSDATVITGEAELSSEGNGPVVLKKGSHVPPGGGVKTGSGAALFELGNRVFVKEGSQSSMVLTSAPGNPNSPNGSPIRVNLSTGELYAGNRGKKSASPDFRVVTPTVEAISHGSLYRMSQEGGTAQVWALKGPVEVRYCHGSKTAFVKSGQSLKVQDCEATRRDLTLAETQDLTRFQQMIDKLSGGPSDPGSDGGGPVLSPIGVLTPIGSGGGAGSTSAPVSVNTTPLLPEASQ